MLPAGVLVKHPEEHLDRLLGVVGRVDETVSSEELLDLVQITRLEHHYSIISEGPHKLVFQRKIFVHLHQILGLNNLIAVHVEKILRLLAHIVFFLIFLV